MGLGDERFEEFCTELLAAAPEFSKVRRHGRPGEPQGGIDAGAERGGRHVGIQYRRVQAFGPKAFEVTVAEATYEADDYIVILGSKASSFVRNAVRKTSNWELWDAEDVAIKLRALAEPAARRILDAYFNPAVRALFLGRVGPATFHDLEEHFRPTMQEGRLFDHRLALVGREDVLAALGSFLDDPNLSIAVLPGRGGVGKSRILKAFGESVQGSGWTVLFAAENASFDPAGLDELPPEPCLIFVDDGHRSPELMKLVSHLADRRNPAKLVVAIRPEGRSLLTARLRDSGVDVRSVSWLQELAELDRQQGEALARAALGEDLAHLAGPVYQATRDCTLVTVVAARLLRERQVSPALLTEDEEFRDGVLARFRDESLGRVSERLAPDIALKTLEVVSALQPLTTEAAAVRDSAAAFIGISGSDFVRAVDELEIAGVLLRRGYSVRIVPDVLGDYILGAACLTSAGRPTGLADELVEHFCGVAFDRLLANLSEVDWRIRSKGKTAPDLVGTMWATFEAGYRAARNVDRQNLLGWLRPVAAYQPERVIDLAEWTLSNAAPDGAAADIRVDKHEAVVSMLPGLLEACAYGGHLERVCALLWRMGRDDDRETGRFPDHPMRVLTRIGGYGPATPVGISERVAAVAMTWLGDPEVATYAHSPFDVLAVFLAKGGLDPVSDGHQITYGQFRVNPATTGALRTRVIDKALDVAVSGHPKVALAAVRVLEGGLGDPVGFFGRVVSPEEKAVWEDEERAVLRGLLDVAGRIREPIVLLKLRHAVRWSEVRGHSTAIRAGAREVREAVPDDFELRLTAALVSPWSWDRHESEPFDVGKAEQERVGRLRTVADELLQTWPEVPDLAANLGLRLKAIANAGEQSQPGYLLGMVCRGSEPLATGLAVFLIEHPEHPLAAFLAVPLRELRPLNEAVAIDLADQAWESGGDVARAAVASLYGPATWAETITPRELGLLKKVVQTHVGIPWSSGTGGVEALATSDVSEAKAMAMAIEPVDRYQSEALSDLLEPGGQLFSALSDDDLADVVAKFVEPPTVDEYHTQVLMAGAALRRPAAVVEMLLARIDAAADRDIRQYHPIPFEVPGAQWWSGLDSNARREGLALIRDAMLLPRTAARVASLADLFSWVAGEWAEEAQTVVLEWVESGNEEKARASLALVGHAPREIVFEQPGFVDRVLAAAERISPEVLASATGALRAASYHADKHRRVMVASPQDQWVIDHARTAAAAQPAGSRLRRLYEHIAAWAESMQERMRKADEEMLD